LAAEDAAGGGCCAKEAQVKKNHWLVATPRLGLAAAFVLAACSARDGSEDVSVSSASLTSNCPENRTHARWDGPASWQTKFNADVICLDSRYNCGVAGADRRFENPEPKSDGQWPAAAGTPIFDGRGNRLGEVPADATSVKLNFGQTKELAGRRYVYAFAVHSPSNQRPTSGWIDVACVGWDGKTRPDPTCVTASVKLPSSFPTITGRKPPVDAGSVADYEIDPVPGLFANQDLTKAKIVCNSPLLDSGLDDPSRALADYFPRRRDDGTYTINLILTVPGMHPSLGGTATDTFVVAHTENGAIVSHHVTFHRLTKVRSVVAFLFEPQSVAGAFGEKDPRTVFVYGYVLYSDGAQQRRRYGWIDFQALKKK
jgi:hypothetical protein